MSPAFPDPDWFEALGARMQGERFRRLGFVETRFVVSVLPDADGDGHTRLDTGLVFEGYGLAEAKRLSEPWAFDPDFLVCGRASAWHRMLEEVARSGRPGLRQTLNSLVLIGDELWLESRDQIREDKFYRYNHTLQEFFNLASSGPGESPH